MRGIAKSLNISRSEILRKKRRRKGTEDEKRTQNAPSPLQKRCKDYKKRGPEEIFKEYGFKCTHVALSPRRSSAGFTILCNP